MTNPVKHGIVESAADFPGVRSRLSDIGSTLMIEKPKSLFRSGNLPEAVPLRLTMPPALRARLRREATVDMFDAIARAEHSLRTTRRAAGQGFLGMEQALRTKPTDRPGSGDEDDRDGFTTPTGRPRYLKCFDPKLRKHLRAKLRSFRQAHDRAWERYLDNPSEVIFPFGTWRMQEVFGMPVDTPQLLPTWTLGE